MLKDQRDRPQPLLHRRGIQQQGEYPAVYRDVQGGNIAIAHNGNLTNFREIRKKLQDAGTIFQTTSDTEVILHLIARSPHERQIDQIRDAIAAVRGAFSIVIRTDTALIAARDHAGFRPLALGKKDGAFVIASETVGFDIMDAEYVRDVQPGGDRRDRQVEPRLRRGDVAPGSTTGRPSRTTAYSSTFYFSPTAGFWAQRRQGTAEAGEESREVETCPVKESG